MTEQPQNEQDGYRQVKEFEEHTVLLPKDGNSIAFIIKKDRKIYFKGSQMQDGFSYEDLSRIFNCFCNAIVETLLKFYKIDTEDFWKDKELHPYKIIQRQESEA